MGTPFPLPWWRHFWMVPNTFSFLSDFFPDLYLFFQIARNGGSFLLAAAIILLLIFIFVVLLSDIAWSRLLLASSNICFAIFICSLVFETSLSNSLSLVSNLLHFFCTVFSEAFPFFFLFSSSFSLSFCLLLTSFPSSSCFFMQCTNDEFSLQLHMYLLIRSRHDLAFFFKSSEIHRSFIRQQCFFIGQCVFLFERFRSRFALPFWIVKRLLTT